MKSGHFKLDPPAWEEHNIFQYCTKEIQFHIMDSLYMVWHVAVHNGLGN